MVTFSCWGDLRRILSASFFIFWRTNMPVKDMEKPRFGASEPWRLLPIGKVLDIPLRNGPPPGYVR